MVKGKYEETNKGTPQGGNLSPLLSNIMLNELDKELEARKLHFVRYADDCVIAVGSRAAANRVMHTITKWIEKKLNFYNREIQDSEQVEGPEDQEKLAAADGGEQQ